MLTSRFLFMFIYSMQNYKPIKFCTCSCPNRERRLKKKHYLENDALKRIITEQIPKIRCYEKNYIPVNQSRVLPPPQEKRKAP